MESTLMLSILVCHLQNRVEEFNRLGSVLQSQVDHLSDIVEVIVRTDNGEEPTGLKRNILIDNAHGKYVAFVDDDDLVTNDYVSSILTAVQSDPDCVGIEGILRSNQGDFNFKHSIEFAGWYTGIDAFYRWPNHLNPIRRSIAEKVRFNPTLTVGEDQDFSRRLRPLLKTEEYIDHPIYIYIKPEIEK